MASLGRSSLPHGDTDMPGRDARGHSTRVREQVEKKKTRLTASSPTDYLVGVAPAGGRDIFRDEAEHL